MTALLKEKKGCLLVEKNIYFEEEKTEVFKLGRTEFKVKRIGFGGMTIPEVSREEAIETINKALDLGVNFIDTARAYGDSEEKIGYVMKNRKEECYLSSRSLRRDYKGMKQDIEKSLKTLNTEYIDLYEPHDVSTAVAYERLLSENGALKALKEAKSEGKIRCIGFTSHNWELIKKLIQTDEFDAALVVYNVADRNAEKIIPLAKEHNVGLFVMKVFGNSKLLEMTPIGEKRKLTVEECLRFALSNKNFPLILTGAKSPEEIEENVSIAKSYIPLTDEEEKNLKEFGDKLGHGYCYGCNYCMPCPQEIDIPKIMQLLETGERIDWHWPQLKEEYRKLKKTFDDCTDCEECEERCPQNLPIRKRLKKAKENLGSGLQT